MNPKFLVFLLGICAVGGVLYFVHQTTQVDLANGDLLSAQSQLTAMKQGFDYQTKALENKKVAHTLLAQLAELRAEQGALAKAIQQVKDSENTIAEAFKQAVQRARANMVGQSIDALLLANGSVLRHAKIQRCDDEGMTVVHDGGVSKVTGPELNEELQKKLRYRNAIENEEKNNRASLTYASDQLRLLGQQAGSEEAANAKTKGSSPAPTSVDAPVRTSLGRVYVPGKGWVEKN